jgi:ribosomal protein S18 acetylase RimI-like enzyme
MDVPRFGGKPAVLRCARCGRLVDWEDARLQVVCGCRPRIELPPVVIRPGEPDDRPAVVGLFERDFGATEVVAFGERVVLVDAPVLVAWRKGELAGALAYRLVPDALVILALATDPMWQRSGVGGDLVAEAEALARRERRTRVRVSTTNDNLPALYFYQRRQYRITEVVPGGLLPHLGSRDVKGFGGIPPRDEIRLERLLD